MRSSIIATGGWILAVFAVTLSGCGNDQGGAGANAGSSAGDSSAGGSGSNGGGGSTTGGSGSSGGNGSTSGTSSATATAGTATGGSTAGSGSGSTGEAECPLFTLDDPWNTDISAAPVSSTWTERIAALVGDINIHPDFGPDFGIPINVVPATAPAVPVTFDAYADESDPGPYPFPDPSVANVEGTDDPTSCDGDCHLLVVQQGVCQLYEGYACHYEGGWHCDNGAHWDLTKKSYGQRPVGWTSADAAGLPIYAGLARYDEAAAGEITHAIRFTLKCTQASYVMPATHDAVPGSCDPTNPNAPPMGLRVRLKASFDISGFGPMAQTFLRAFKKYGLILADNGSNFFFQSEDSPNWPDEINDLKQVPASAFEVVDPGM